MSGGCARAGVFGYAYFRALRYSTSPGSQAALAPPRFGKRAGVYATTLPARAGNAHAMVWVHSERAHNLGILWSMKKISRRLQKQTM
jgi:hypothetical protein